MKTLTIVSQKGGSGKTTLAVHLAVYAYLHGLRVALIDIDPQGSQVGWASVFLLAYPLPHSAWANDKAVCPPYTAT